MRLQVEPYREDEQGLRDGDRTDAATLDVAVGGGELAEAKDRVAALESSLASQARAHADLIHLLTHELRTPITVINGFSRLLLDSAHGALTERQLGFVKESLKACRRLDLLVRDLIEASPESGSPLRVELERADLDETIRSTLDSLAPILADRGARVELDFDTPIRRVDFDPVRIEQVVTNLLTNAIRYGRAGGSIRIGRFETDADGASVVQVFVEDDGPGIAEVDRKRVFEPYQRVGGDSECAGMGIGLAICQRIVASHSGTLRVEDGSNGGARFVFTLPISQSRPQE
jgi:two-component system sensor histidine kinase KdpD